MSCKMYIKLTVSHKVVKYYDLKYTYNNIL